MPRLALPMDVQGRCKMNLKTKFRLMIGLAAGGLVMLAGCWLINERSRILAEKQEKLRNLVETACSVASQYQELEAQGKLPRAAAQQRAIETLKAMRYEGENYFWINDLRPTMVMHPTKPQLDGKDLGETKDPAGKALFVEMVNVVKSRGAGFVSYSWPKPGADRPVPKLSYVKGFQPWGWVIGTGIYVDDVDAILRKSALAAGGVSLACFLMLSLTSLSTYRSIFRRLEGIVERIKDVAQGEGDLTKRIPEGSADEISELARWFNTFMDELQGILSKVSATTESLAVAGQQISVSSRQQAEGAQAQKDQTTQVVTAMQQMTSTVQQVSENSNNAAAASQKAAETARQGGKVMEETLSRMRAIASSTGETANKIGALGKQSDQIGGSSASSTTSPARPTSSP